MRRLWLHRDDDGRARREPQGRELLAVEVQRHGGLLQVPRDLVQRALLGHDRDLETLGYVARLMRRAFDIDVLACPACGGWLRLIAFILDSQPLRAMLGSLGVSTEDPDRAPPSGPACVVA